MKTQLYQSTFRPTVQTNLTRKRRFSKTFFKPEEFKTALRFSVNEKHFLKTDDDNHVILLSQDCCPRFPRPQIQNDSLIGDFRFEYEYEIE